MTILIEARIVDNVIASFALSLVQEKPIRANAAVCPQAQDSV
jgi:hypothetical protein